MTIGRNISGSDAAEAIISLGALLLFAGSPWLVDQSGPSPFYKGPAIFPMIVLGMVALAGLPAWWRILDAWRHYELGSIDTGSFGISTAFRVVPLMCLFPFGLLLAGPETATFVFAGTGLLLAGYRRIGTVLTVCVALTVAIHLIFRQALDIWFPEPVILQIFQAG